MKHLVILVALCWLAVGCTSSGPSLPDSRDHNPQSVIGQTWQWVGTLTPVKQIAVTQPERYTLHFDENGRVQARFDCNRGGGGYTISQAKLTFGPLMSTRMACPDDSLDAIFMNQLQAVSSFFIEGDSLYLELKADSSTMRFKQQVEGR